MKTKTVAVTGLLIFFLLLISSGFMGLYAIKTSYMETSRYIEAVDIARKVQFYFQRQNYLLKIIILQGDVNREYRMNFHSFTFNADRAQDLLFNLKLICKDIKGVPETITSLRTSHSEVTREYVFIILRLAETNFANGKETLHKIRDKDREVIVKMDEIVRKIEATADGEITNINNYYYQLVLTSMILIVIIAAAAGLYFFYELTNIHRGLESRVKERTKELDKLNRELSDEIAERKRAEHLLKKAKEDSDEINRLISISEKKYRHLIEESGDIIFSLDENFCFINANRAISTHLKLSPLAITDISFIDLLYAGANGRTAARQFIMEKLEAFSRERKPVEFTAQFTSSYASEPKEMHVRMEFISIDGRSEIHGVASAVSDDTLLNYFISERQKYSISNYLSNIEDVTLRITQNLKKYLDSHEVSIIRIGLREMIINAIEHGNLEISFQEKTKALNGDSYIRLIESRRNNPEFSRRSVEIEYLIEPEKAVYKITDQGKGFNHKEILNRNIAVKDGEILPHGRGIMMTKEIFDEIKYNDIGNQALLVKIY